MNDTHRPLVDAECYTPERLTRFIVDIESASHSSQVWDRIVQLGRNLELPYVDFISASNMQDWRKTLFIRTSYDSGWLQDVNDDPALQQWSYFRSHAIHYLTPIAVGLEFLDEYRPIPETRRKVLEEAAKRGIRSGFSIPLRVHAPPQAALITFSGPHSKRHMREIIRAHGWTLHAAAMIAHQRYIRLFEHEFTERNHVTSKQLELIKHIGLGLQDKEIADLLGISISAVRQRMQSLLTNTGLNSRTELAALAMSVGILPHPFSRPDGEGETLVEMDEGGMRQRPAHAHERSNTPTE